MNGKWHIEVWGVRGSFPKSTMREQAYGGNTSCISATCGETAIVLDAGSGFAGYAQTFQKERTGGRLNLLVSHLHFDHVMGLFYFFPMFDPDLEIHIYGCEGLRTCLEELVREPYWPVRLQDFPAKLIFHEIAPADSFRIDDVQVDTMAANHPGGGLLYRLTCGGKSLVYGLDCELSDEISPQFRDFAAQSDLLIWDANFSSGDIRPGWGHSTWEQGIAMRRACGAKQVMMTHYNWIYTDEQLRRLEQEAAREDDCCCFAREGMTLTL